jgi:hypothetical protein
VARVRAFAAAARLPRGASVEGGDKKYSVTALIPKSDTATIEAIKAAAKAAKEAKFGTAAIKGMRHPLRDGDEVDGETGERVKGAEFAGHYYIGASSKRKVAVDVMSGGKMVPAPAEHIVSGYYANIAINLYSYDVSGSKGVTAGLNGVLITKRGEPLGRTVQMDTSGAEDFAVADEAPF